MKAIQSTKRTAALGLSALILSSVLLCGVSCTRNDNKNPGDTTANDSQTTVTTNNGGSKPLDPDAGTVAPDSDAGDPPAGTEGGTEGRSILPRFMR